MNNNSNNNSSRGTTPGSEPPRPQLKYNLAALRLAQSSNNSQDSQIHIVSDAPSASMASSVFISPAASAHVVASSTPSNASPYATIVRGAGAPRGAGSSIVASPANAATAALLTALHIGGDDRPVPASANNTPSAPVAPTAKYTASTTAVPPSLPQQQPPWATPTAAGLGMASFVKTASNTPPAPRSFPLQQQQATATVLAGPQRATLPLGGAQLPGPAPFTTAVPFPIKAAPATPSAAGNGVAAQLVGLSDGDPSRRSVMAMAPMSGAMSQAPQLSFGPAEPTPPAPQLPQSRGVANATYVKPFQQKLPMPAQPQPQPQLPSPNPAGSRSVPSGQSTPPQPGRPCLFPQQPQQPQLPLQFQQQQWQPKMQILQHQQVPFQAKPPAPNSLVPAPRTQRDGRANVISVADNCPSPATAAATHMQPPPTQLNAQMPLPSSSSSSSGHQPPLGVASLPLSPPQQQQQQQQQQLPFPLPQPMSKGGLPLRPEMSLPAVAQPAGSMNPAAPVAGNAPNVVNRCNTAGPTTAVAAAPSSGAASASKPTSASCGSPSPPTASLPAMAANAASAAATAASSATVAGGPIMDIQQVLQRMGISAHMASTPPSTTSAAAAAVAAAAAAVPSTNTAATSAQLSQLMQRQERQQQQQAPLNFYSTPAGAAASAFQQPLYPPQYQQQQRRRQQEPRFQPRHGRDGSNGGGGGNAGGNHQRYFDPSHQQRQQQHGRGAPALPRSVQNARAAQHPSPDAPVSHFAAPDPETLKRFKNEYAQQEDAESVSDELKAQQATKVGTVGTLDEEVCLSLIESHDVIFVVTDTGTGKSTRIPIALHKAYPDALIVNAQPRRTAAINLAQRVAEVLDEKLGEEVGYSVRGEHIGDLGNTKVMYVTTYSLFVFFLWHELKEKLPFTYIIVDEFHERTPDVEVILLMLKLWLKKHPKAFKLILCSATAQMEEWQNFFDGLSVGTYFRSPIMYPVREYFIEDLQKLLGFRAAPISPQDSNNMVTSQQMHQLILVCKQLLEYLAKNTATQDSVLVFMPGRTQVELMTTWMRDNLEESVEPVAWYRDVDLSVIQEALARSAVTRKKVYVATDIAEVSLTLPDVVFVIDSGTGKRPQVSEKEQTSYAFPPLRLLWETASNAQQRRGRVGRVQQGFYFSLLSHEHHKTLRETENRIKNAVLTELVLHSLLITQRPFAFFQLCNERPEKGALSYSLHLLQDGGLIIGKDDALAEAERVALDRSRTSYVIDSPWNALIEEALTETQPTTAATEETQPNLAVSASASAADMRAKEQDATAQPRPSGEESNSDAEGSDDDDDDVRIPEAEGSAFQQRYYMTLRGVIAARSPVSVAAATNIFYGLLCGTPTLSMLAAAIESSKSPFHVPYTINDRVERAGMVRAVSQVMQRYHGSLQSDLICAMEVVLEYMSMQRDGLSEEAQEEWCQDRSISRTRVVDTLNLFAQMKEQVSSVLPFPDVTDIDVLTAQFNQNAELLVLMLVASHTELAIQVQLDGPVAQKKGFVGHGVFFPLKCLKDESVPTVCPWERTKISVPLSLQTIQRKVLAVFSSQVEPDLFALVVLVFSFKLRYTVLESDTVPSYLMSVSHSGVRRTFRCDVLTAQQILQLRRIQCAQLRCMQLQVEERVNANESEKLSAALKSANSDFGLPASAVETPYLIPTVLQHGLKLLVSRLRGSPSFSAPKQPITDFPAGTAYCKLQHTAELSPPILQSVLVHSNNGLSIVQPVVSPLSAKSAAEGNGQAAAGASPSATTADAEAVKAETEAASQYDAEADDDTSEKSSETGSEEHVATFRYDL